MILEKYAPALANKINERFPFLNNGFFPLAIIVGVVSGLLVVLINQPLYILLGVLGVLIFVLTIYSPQLGLLILVFISYTRFSDVFTEFHNSPSIAKPFMAMIVISILTRWALFREPPKGWYFSTLLFGLVLVAEFASVIYSPVPDRSLARWTDDVKDTLIAIVVVILMQAPSAFRRVTWTLIFSGIFLCSLSVYQYITGTYDNNYGGFALSLSHQIIGAIDDFRATGPMGDPNYFAQIAVVFVPISLERFMHDKRMRNRLLALWCLVTSVITVIITYSRGGLFAMVLGVLIFFLFYPPKRNHVVFIILSLVALYGALPRNYVDRLMTFTMFFENTGTQRLEERSFQGRLSENLTALEMIKDKPLFGVGLNSYKYLFPTYSKRLGLALVATEREAHNTYLEILAETGIVGFLIFTLMLGASIMAIIKARESFVRQLMPDYAGMTVGFLGGFAAYFFAAIFLHNGFPRYFYLLLGIAFALTAVAQNAYQEPEKGHS